MFQSMACRSLALNRGGLLWFDMAAQQVFLGYRRRRTAIQNHVINTYVKNYFKVTNWSVNCIEQLFFPASGSKDESVSGKTGTGFSPALLLRTGRPETIAHHE